MINNDNFKVKQIPDLHPIAQMYERDEFWREQKKLAIEGMWSGGKWCPPELYYYINFHNIKFESDGGLSTAIGLPFFRDLEWEKAYIYTEACGFSGFENDDKYTCHRWYGPEKEKAIKYGKITEEEVKSKIYLPVQEYLNRPYLSSTLGRPIYANAAKNVLDGESRGTGKDLENNTLVYTKEGSKKIKDINIGEYIYGADGKLTKVIDKKSFSDQLQYKITFADGRTILAGGGHLWTVYDVFKKINDGKITINTEEIYKTYKAHIRKNHNGNYNFDSRYFVQINKGYEGEEKELPLDPYYLGLWLGDGNSHNTGITTIDDEIKDYIYYIANKLDLKVTPNYNKNKTCPTYNINSKIIKVGSNPLLCALKDLNLIKNKHIPDIYFKASFKQRLELLKGLLDSDGHIGKKMSIEFSSSIDLLAKDVINLTRGLGIRTSFSTRIPYYKKNGKKIYGKKNYRIILKPTFDVFKLSRKSNLFKELGNYANSTHNKISIKNVEPIKVMPSTCIAVDNEDKLFIAGDYIVTHNSYWASGCISHNFLFDGARNYDEHLKRRLDGNPYVSDTVVGAIDAKYSNDLLSKVKVGIENLPGSKIIINNFGETEIHPSPLSTTITGSLAPGRNWRSSTSSVLNHRTFQDNPLAANGTRPNRAFIEEAFFMNNLIETWGALEATQAAAQHKRLVIYALGTGGLTTAGAALYAQEIFYNPEEYNCLVFEDHWENKGKICYFVPAWKGRNEFKEGPNLITNEEKAKQAIEEEIEDAKKGNSKTKLLAKIINNPRVPSEIFLRKEGTFFPIQDLKQALADLESNKILLKSSYKVDLLEKTKGNVIMIPSEKSIIIEYPLRKSDNMDACIEIYQKPKLDSEGRVISNRYIMSTDPVDDDGNDDIKRSLQSTFVLDTWTDEIVAEYTARTYLASEYYENVRKLCIMYNAKNLYESNKKGMYGYFNNKHALHYLAETPQILQDKELAKGNTVGNRSLGVNMSNDRVKLYGIQLALEWLESPSYRNPDIKRLYTIRGQAFLKELISYSMDGNFDRISAFIVLMIYRAELNHQIEATRQTNIKTTTQSSFWGNAYKSFNKDKVHKQMQNLLNNYDVE